MNSTPRSVLVVEDDPDTLRLYEHLFETEPRYQATFCSSPREAVHLLGYTRFDVLITDFHMPAMDGLELAERAKEVDPGILVMLVTAYPTLEAAVRAVKASVTDFITKPLRRETMFAAIDAALATRSGIRKHVLAIGAHPDDIEIGAGATLAQHIANHDDVTLLTMSRGQHGGDPDLRVNEAHEAAARLGAHLIMGDLADTKIPDHGPTIELIEQAVRSVQPDIIYVHSANDVHQDHRAVHAATRVAARGVPKILCYQSPSATIDFRPAVFVPVVDGLPAKLHAIDAYQSQTSTRDYLAPDVLTSTARYWGRFAKVRYVEPFEVLRDALEVSHASH